MASLMDTKPSIARPSSLRKSPMPKYLGGGVRRTRPKSRLQTKGPPSRNPVTAPASWRDGLDPPIAAKERCHVHDEALGRCGGGGVWHIGKKGAEERGCEQ